MKTAEQKEATDKLKTFFEENKLNKEGEISMAIYRLMCLDFNGGNGLTLQTVSDKLPIAFDKYIERGFKLTPKEKDFLQKNKEIILSFIIPFYWEENNRVVGRNFELGFPEHIDNFGGVFNLNTNDFAM